MNGAHNLTPARGQTMALIVAAVGGVICAAGVILAPTHFFRAYLFAYVFWLAPALGCFGILMIHHLTGGRWGVALRRVLEAAASTLPLMALLFVPVGLGVYHLYPWTDTTHLDEVLQEKALYLNLPFFFGRAAGYFILWSLFVWLLLRSSHAQEQHFSPGLTRRARVLSGPGLMVYVLGMTFAAVDWVMSLEPHWFSSIFGVVMIAAQGLAGLAFAILVLTWLSRTRAIDFMTPALWNDLGNLLLAFVMVWTYVSFSQFLLIWSGNLPEEIIWYEHRSEGVWLGLAVLLFLFNFAVPFLALLMRDVKRHPEKLGAVAGLVLGFSVINHYWLVVPSFAEFDHAAHSDSGHDPFWLWIWLDAAALAALGGIWIWFFLMRLSKRPLVPRPTPEWRERGHHG